MNKLFISHRIRRKFVSLFGETTQFILIVPFGKKFFLFLPHFPLACMGAIYGLKFVLFFLLFVCIFFFSFRFLLSHSHSFCAACWLVVHSNRNASLNPQHSHVLCSFPLSLAFCFYEKTRGLFWRGKVFQKCTTFKTVPETNKRNRVRIKWQIPTSQQPKTNFRNKKEKLHSILVRTVALGPRACVQRVWSDFLRHFCAA